MEAGAYIESEGQDTGDARCQPIISEAIDGLCVEKDVIGRSECGRQKLLPYPVALFPTGLNDPVIFIVRQPDLPGLHLSDQLADNLRLQFF